MHSAKKWICVFMVVCTSNLIGQGSQELETKYESALPNYFPLNRKNFTRLSSTYGYRIHPLRKKIKKHKGIDLVAKKGSAVYASARGKVLESGFDKGYGNYVLLLHEGQTKTLYAHLLYYIVKKSEMVSKGQIIGAVGDSGMVTGPHLHYEIWIKGKSINPLLYWNRNRIKTNTVKVTAK